MALTRELDGVGQQVQEDLLQSIGISFEDESMTNDHFQVKMEGDCGLFDGGDLGNLVDQVSDVERIVDDPQGVELTAPEVEKITDH